MATTGSQQPTIAGIEPEYTKEEKDKFAKKWAAEGEDLARRSNKTQWDLGDWLIEGERRLLSRAYRDAMRITGLARATLWDIKGVADFFDGSTPRDVARVAV
ncbi:MAG: hypothetical protein WB630_12015 [Candidatus Acidiferrales bacterium]